MTMGAPSDGWNGVQTRFKGVKNDIGQKFVSQEYFYDSSNVNYDDIIGANKILMPEASFSNNSNYNIDGIFEYKYLDDSNQIVSVYLTVFNGNVYKNWYPGSGTLTSIYSGIGVGKCQFSVLNDQVFITNGLTYPIKFNGVIASQMGAPYAYDNDVLGNPNGSYYYEMTFVTDGGEERIGTVSNTLTVENSEIRLEIPIGYAGTTSRKIYRTKNGGSILYLVGTINDNETLEFIDNVADASLTVPIISINNECPKVKYIATSYERIIGAGDLLYPTQAFVTDSECEVFDAANFVGVTNVGDDGTQIMGMAIDYSKIVIGSQKNIYVMDVSETTPTVTLTRGNIGVLDGYSMVPVPKQGDFVGGVMFLSTEKDVRVFNGNFAQPVPTSLDNLAADNYSQNIRQTMDYYVEENTNVFAEFHDYKYHLILNNIIVFYDTRIMGWGIYEIESDSFSPSWNYLASIGGELYAGQVGDTVIDKFYSTITYKDEEVPAFVQSGQLYASNEVMYLKDFIFFVVSGADDLLEVEIVIDGQSENAITYQVPLSGGSFDSAYFSPEFYSTGDNVEDYRVLHINQWGRWIQYTIKQTKGRTFFRGFKLVWEKVKNSE